MTREQWVMRRPAALPTPIAVPGEHVIRPFHPERDVERAELLRVNAAAFAWHPEQGDMDAVDLDRRMAEPWFDPHGLLMLWAHGPSRRPSASSGNELWGEQLDAFHWTKVHIDGEHAGLSEVYVLAVDPGRQGHGLGSLALVAGLEHLAVANPGQDVILYVEATNTGAIGLYERFGFSHAETRRLDA